MSNLYDILTLENKKWQIDQFTAIFIFLGVLMQIIVYRVTDAPSLSLYSGIFGIVSVVLCSNRKMAFYLFGFAQLLTYVMLCLEQNLYGEIAENTFYFVTMLFGMYHWAKHYDEEKTTVETRKLNLPQKVWIVILTVLVTAGLYNVLVITDDTQPFLDSVTTVPAFVAQILLITRFKDSWHYWLTIDLGSIVMWAIAGDWCMVAQFVFWTANCIYGLKKW